jgi:predicted nucleotidyltransferase
MKRVFDMSGQVAGLHVVSFGRERLAEFCQRRRIRKLALFGSILRDDFGPESDIDVLVEFIPGQRVTLLDMVDMEEELSDLMGGMKVDLRTPGDLHQRFRHKVLNEAEVLYTHEGC